MARGRPPQIIAYGGGGFSMEPGNPLLDEYVLSLCRRKKPRVCFFPTASGDADHYVVRFYRHFSSEICDPSHISLFRRDRGPGQGPRAPAQTGPDLRRRRIDPVAARRVAGARDRRGSARGVAGGCHPCRRVRRVTLLVRVRPDGLPPRCQALRRAGLPPALQRGALRGRGQPAAGVPLRAAGRLAARRLCGLRRRGAALRRRGPAPGRALAPRGARVPGRGGRRRGRGAPAGGDLSRRTAEDHPCRRLNGGPTILAMGGGGFTMEPENPALDDYVLGLAEDAPMPQICLLPTASGDGEAQIRQFHATFGARACEPMHISLFRLGSRPIPLRETLLDAGHHLRRRRLDARPARRLARARPGRDPARGVGGRRVLAGLSRGRDVLVRVGRHEVARRTRRPRPASASCPARCPCTWTASPRRLPICRASIADGTIPPGYAADDGVALLFRGTELADVVSSRPNRKALRLGPDGRGGARAAPARASPTASARRPRSPSTAACARSPRRRRRPRTSCAPGARSRRRP